MPLPPALLKRLANRGILNVNNKNVKEEMDMKGRAMPENEEIIAEDYDEMEDPLQYDQYEPIKKPENVWIERMKSRMVEGNTMGYKWCPNKYNIYHKCTLFCVNRWTTGIPEPSKEYLKRKARLLKKYPLPKNWIEIYDRGIGCHYYCNTKDDTVSWLPPHHPKSVITKSAAVLRRELDEVNPQSIEENDKVIPIISDKDLDEILNIPQKMAENAATLVPSPEKSLLKKAKNRNLDKVRKTKDASRHRDQNKNRRYKKSGGIESDPLDPMDPAAYSDIPRGKWSDGLNVDDSKSAVDPTVSGTLFQARPYPSPGAVLQANEEANKSTHTDDSDSESRDCNND